MAKEKACGIYAITNKINGKKYIGQSKNIYCRWKEHISSLKNNKHHSTYLQRSWNKHGKDNFMFEIIKLCDKKDLTNLEFKYIKELNTTDSDFGYNMSGSKQYLVKPSEEARGNMRKSQKSIPIIQLDIHGNIIKIWRHGARHASSSLDMSQSSIWHCCNSDNVKTYKGYIWMKESEYSKDLNILEYLKSSQRVTPIVQLSLDGERIMEFSSPKEAFDKYGFDSNAISKCIRGVINTHKGYYWIRKEDYISKRYSLKVPNKTRIIQFDLNNNLIKEWGSIAEASRYHKINEASIRNVCNGKSKTGCGFIWKYKTSNKT